MKIEVIEFIWGGTDWRIILLPNGTVEYVRVRDGTTSNDCTLRGALEMLDAIPNKWKWINGY